MFPCPCCGFLTYEEPPGSYEICSICGWEDDPVQAANPCYAGGANSESLERAQDNFQSTPDADLNEYKAYGFQLDAKWRPLNVIERQIFSDELTRATRCPNPPLTEISQYYWNRNIVEEKR